MTLLRECLRSSKIGRYTYYSLVNFYWREYSEVLSQNCLGGNPIINTRISASPSFVTLRSTTNILEWQKLENCIFYQGKKNNNKKQIFLSKWFHGIGSELFRFVHLWQFLELFMDFSVFFLWFYRIVKDFGITFDYIVNFFLSFSFLYILKDILGIFLWFLRDFWRF